jgi:hypothetical protein
MPFGRASLSITRFGEKSSVVLVPAVVGLRMRSEQGMQPMGRGEALARFDDLASASRTRVREFVVEARLTRSAPRDLDDHEVCALVRAAIRDGSLVAVRPAEAHATASQTARRRQLVRDIQARTRGPVTHGGRTYRLVVDLDLAALPDRDRYEVVDRAAAAEILTALATTPFRDGELAALWVQALAQLTADWRPGMAEPDGLVFLRRIRNLPVAPSSNTPAITPSQLKALTAAGWIEIEFVDGLGNPVAVDCRLELPNATLVEAANDSRWFIAKRSFAPGMCRLSLPGLDGNRWRREASF